jgi:DNA-directed RNA polymerase specialized sigma subunit
MVQLQGLRRHSAREQQVVSMPERVALDLHKLSLAENELRDSLNRDPSDAELSEHVGLSPKRIGYIRTARPAYAEGTINASSMTDEDQGGFSPSVQQQGVEPHLLGFVYHGLEPVDQVIMEHTLGLHGKKILSKQEIAKRVGISPAAISQRSARIQEKLNLIDDSWPLGR